MKNQIDIRWLIRRVSFLLGVNLTITGGIAVVVILDVVLR